MGHHRDAIYDNYYGKNDSYLHKETRERLHWMMRQVHGTFILDVGCSQGVLPILLGREAKRVTGIDVSSSAIDVAWQNLRKEEKKTQNQITYIKDNLFQHTCTSPYDTVILGHVLTEVVDVDALFKKAHDCLKEDGHIIVTTPLGFTESNEHKQTFYINDFLSLQTEAIAIENIQYFNHWIGVVYRKQSEACSKSHLLTQNMGELEEAFKAKEENLVSEQHALKKQINVLKEKLDSSEECNEELHTRIGEYANIKEEFLQEKNKKVNVQKELYDAYDKQKEIIKDYRKLSEKHERVQTRYNNLRQSKLGKLTIKYWKLRQGKRSK